MDENIRSSYLHKVLNFNMWTLVLATFLCQTVKLREPQTGGDQKDRHRQTDRQTETVEVRAAHEQNNDGKTDLRKEEEEEEDRRRRS